MKRAFTICLALGSFAVFYPVTTDARPSRADAAGQRLPIVSGQLVGAHGRPLRAWVWLSLPPQTGKGGPSLLLARGRADANGRYRLSLSSKMRARAGMRGLTNNGWVNLDLLVTTGHLYLYRSIARRFLLLVGKWTARGSSVPLLLAKGKPGVALPSRPFPFPARAAVPPACYETSTVVGHTDRQTVVGELHTASGVTGEFDYGRTADTDVGVGFTAGTGSWSISGEAHVANSTGAAATWTRSSGFHRQLSTSFHYVKLKTYDPCFGSRYTEKATRWNGGAKDSRIAQDPSNGCQKSSFRSHSVPFSAGTSFRRDAKRAAEYRAAVDVLGVKLSATSGYSKFVQVQWMFESAGVLCGDSGFPTDAQRIFAGH